MKRLREQYEVSWQLVSSILANDKQKHWDNLIKAVNFLQKKGVALFTRFEQVCKKHYSKIHNRVVFGKAQYTFDRNCVAISDKAADIIDECRDCGLATFKVGTRRGARPLGDQLHEFEQQLRRGNLPTTEKTRSSNLVTSALRGERSLWRVPHSRKLPGNKMYIEDDEWEVAQPPLIQPRTPEQERAHQRRKSAMRRVS